MSKAHRSVKVSCSLSLLRLYSQRSEQTNRYYKSSQSLIRARVVFRDNVTRYRCVEGWGTALISSSCVNVNLPAWSKPFLLIHLCKADLPTGVHFLRSSPWLLCSSIDRRSLHNANKSPLQLTFFYQYFLGGSGACFPLRTVLEE